MLKYYLLFFSFLAVVCPDATAQNKTITGKVKANDGSELPGVSVFVPGTASGTTTNENGAFTISVSQDVKALVFSFVGFEVQTVELGTKTELDVSLVLSDMVLTEVVVTGAYGAKTSSRATTYSAQVVNDEQLNTIRQTNINNALAGKVAGIQVRSQSVAALGRNTEVRLRGASGFGTGSGALYVVNGTILPNADDVNLDDIETISVLQGPAAAAQFGAQGANGAIVITLKRGVKGQGTGVVLNLGAQFDKVNILPNYQNSYAGGSSSELVKYVWQEGHPVEWQALSGKYYNDYNDDASWGPRMVGQEYIPWYAWYGGHSRSYQTAALNPQPDNAREFYNTGVTLNNSISFSTATDKLNFKMTYGNQHVKGLIPNSKLNKNTLNLMTSYDISKHFEVSANVNYINWKLDGEISDGYANATSGNFNQWFHRNLDMGIMKELQGLQTPEGIYASWNHASPISYDASNVKAFYGGNYWYNPYTYLNLINNFQQRDRIYGDVAFIYKFNDDFRVKATYRKQQNNGFNENKRSTDLLTSALQTGEKGAYSTYQGYSNRQNIDVLATYSKVFGDFKVDLSAGSDFFSAIAKTNYANTVNGLSIPNLYTVGNSVDQPQVGNDRVEEKYRAIFGRAAFGYKNMLFIDGSLRKDWYSTLPTDDNAVLSKSLGASFVFSDLLSNATPWLTMGKLRASWGEIPKALGTTNESFGAYRYPGFAYSVPANKWGTNLLMGTPNQLVDPAISGSVVNQKEIGLDLKFLKSRAGISATYFDGTEVAFPYALSINGASGFTSLLTNIGKISKKGVEFNLNLTPVLIPKFRWDLTATYSNIFENDVIELSDEFGITRTGNLGGGWGTTMPIMVHQKGKRWGQLIGNGIKRINGVPVLDANGFYDNDPEVNFGSVLPKVTGGLQNSFELFNDFTVNVNFDYQFGGKFSSLSNMWGSYSGLTARTAVANDKGNSIRDAVADGGGVHTVGVNAEGEPVDFYVEAQDYFHNLFSKKTFDDYIYDLTYIKLRELSIGYKVPLRKLGIPKTLTSLSVSFVARNPVLIYAKTKDFDPSEVSAIYGETGQYPGTRGYGFNIRVGF
ncbi:SusC/RagA family TonB-linked outer membrane protein [Dyadobacter pollutisoli]|uniref:SusC/RagA family TonB-linked outer membrane protein n=1 Tax=Dyadobacter pollutisoli TaxID=2910158 RepID=A0A9E8SL71_9BACT|nr:SusC/RagA family TonB-linked outer membrane protein [Dyadobacter pollutisoli]WAC13275.1 SusC/RagA family TonB-linked outer membrane protein [Dyadobacter pollutisoli]